ncbi:hypothetical protein FSP39_009792 [Pinctada imbricata]|uniref:CCHC-type domain-containing protein n=1 Tax=Pinctada imbricata TaxID=66713 RepID=A0AA89BSK6_PINIB|nr:hypothetical protein FSP39_009792 [Pinctada imbricata]
MSDEERPEHSNPLPVHNVRTDHSSEESSAFAAFDLFRGYLDSKFSSFKREFSELSELRKDEIVKKIKTDHSYKFKYSGNQKQYEFNDTIIDFFAKIGRASDDRDFRTVSDLCKSATEQLRKRNKCIKLADKSPGGWDTVREYLSDELASDSDDEKRMRSAEYRAIRARKQRRKTSNFIQDRQDRDRIKPNPTYGTGIRHKASATYPNPDSNFRGFRRIGAQPSDICFACNESGHWRKDCPETSDRQSKQQ